MSKNFLEKILRTTRLSRRNNQTDLAEAAAFIEQQREISARYRGSKVFRVLGFKVSS